MTYTMDLPPVFEEIAARQAQKNGKSIEEYLPDLLRKALVQGEVSPASGRDETFKTGADLLALWEQEGAFLSREEMPDSPVYARHLRDESQKPREQ